MKLILPGERLEQQVLALASRLWHDVPMTPRVKNVLFAVFWFVIGHISCAVIHHWHDIAGK